MTTFFLILGLIITVVVSIGLPALIITYLTTLPFLKAVLAVIAARLTFNVK